MNDDRRMTRITPLSETDKWQAVLARDAAHDGDFVFGVLTTGVFCRPSCPSRRARRENVRFYADARAAAAAGLRPCLRCRPLRDADDGAVRTLIALCRRIETRSDESHDLATLGAHAGLSGFQVHRLFKRLLGITPKQYLDAVRMRSVKRGLRSAGSVTDAIYDAGYGSSSRLYERVDSRLGMTPGEYRRGGADVAISFAFARTALGLALIGATDRGICFLQFGEDEGALLEQLAREYPKAALAPMPDAARPQFEAWMQALDAHLQGRAPREKLPLDVRGTAFQQRVWTYLQQIPRGEVMSYAEVAEAIAAPKAARAVASACAHNRIGVLIPCHRVIRGDGGLGGYRWGLPRKRALLDAERAHRGDAE